MDGNRRSARTRNLPVRVGHEEGFDALKRVLSFLLKLDIPHVTVYAFSIENFNRDPTEVDALMAMARTRLVEICQHGSVALSLSLSRALGPRSSLTQARTLAAPSSSSTASRSASSADETSCRSTSRTRVPRPRR